MSNQESPNPLAQRALERLRKLASGNGLEPAAIEAMEIQEDLFTLKGRIGFSPLFETENNAHPGGAPGKQTKKLPNFGALQAAIAEHQQEFRENPDWAQAALQELQNHESHGWGLHGAKITLSSLSATYAATESCPSCSGRKILTCTQCLGKGEVICNQCQGQGREQCYYCMGHGHDPQQPDRTCPTCNGSRYAACRFCQMRGHLPCPTCNGRRGTPCQSCQGSGTITQEVTVTCGAEAHFKLETDNLPSGLRRGLDRIGIMNLGKGHADIVATPITEEVAAEEKPSSTLTPVQDYTAKLPYSEMRMRFGNKKAVISVFGKRCIMLGVPYFLDASLQPWREKLHAAALGEAVLEDACKGRAIGDALSLCIAGKDRVQDLQKFYPLGLSRDAMTSILIDMRLALKRTTLKTRTLMAILSTLFCAGFFYLFFFSGFEARFVALHGVRAGIIADLAALGFALSVSWASLNFSTRFVLKRRFPQLAHAVSQKIGKISYAMSGAIILAYAAILWFAPYKAALVALLKR